MDKYRWGWGVLWLGMGLGIGGCSYLIRPGDAEVIRAQAELKAVEQSSEPHPINSEE